MQLVWFSFTIKYNKNLINIGKDGWKSEQLQHNKWGSISQFKSNQFNSIQLYVSRSSSNWKINTRNIKKSTQSDTTRNIYAINLDHSTTCPIQYAYKIFLNTCTHCSRLILLLVNTSTVNWIQCHILVVPYSIIWSTDLITSSSSESCPTWNEFYRNVVSVIPKPAYRTYQWKPHKIKL
jgi:hypothetical protein